MNINFTGMQNVGSLKKHKKTDHDDRVYRVAIQLNNNGEKDLDSFQKVLEKNPGYKDNGFLDLQLRTIPNRRKPNEPFNDLYINSRKLELNNENLPIFSKISKLLGRISKGEEKIPLSSEYLNTGAFDRFYSETYGRPFVEQQAIVKHLHNPEVVKADATLMSETLITALDNFCLSEPKSTFSGVKNVGGFAYAGEEKEFSRLYLELNDEDMSDFNDYLKGAIKTKYTGTDIRVQEDEMLRMLKERRGESEPKYKSNILNVDLVKDPETGESSILLNGKSIVLNDKTVPVLGKVAELMSKITKTEDELPFSKDYLSREALDRISQDAYRKGGLESFYTMPEEEKKLLDIEFKVFETDKDIKQMASTLVNDIEGRITSYFD